MVGALGAERGGSLMMGDGAESNSGSAGSIPVPVAGCDACDHNARSIGPTLVPCICVSGNGSRAEQAHRMDSSRGHRGRQPGHPSCCKCHPRSSPMSDASCWRRRDESNYEVIFAPIPLLEWWNAAQDRTDNSNTWSDGRTLPSFGVVFSLITDA